MKFLLTLLLILAQFFLFADILPKDTASQSNFGFSIGAESARIIGHGPSMFAVGIVPPSIGINANLLYSNKLSKKRWGKEYSVGFSQRGYTIDRKTYIENLSLDYFNMGINIHKNYSNHSSVHFGGYLSYLLKATYKLGESPTYQVESNYKPIDIGLNASYSYRFYKNMGLRLSQNIGVLPMDQGNTILELNNSTVLSIVLNL
jgi:hypothetical protein